MKRVLCIIGSMNTGGAETFLMKVFRALPPEYMLDFLLSTESGYYEEEIQYLGGRIHRVPLRTKKPISAYKEIKSIVKEYGYKYILKLCDTPIGYFDLLAAKNGGAKRICVRSCNASSSSTGKVTKAINWILRPLFNKITQVKIAPSDLAAKYTFGEKAFCNGCSGQAFL